MTLNIASETSLGLYPKGIFEELSKELSGHFAAKDYGRIKTIYSSAICVDKEVEPFFPIRPLRLYRKEPALAFDYKLSYENFKNMSYNERKKYVATEFLKGLQTALKTKDIREFDIPLFVSDVSLYVESEFLG